MTELLKKIANHSVEMGGGTKWPFWVVSIIIGHLVAGVVAGVGISLAKFAGVFSGSALIAILTPFATCLLVMRKKDRTEQKARIDKVKPFADWFWNLWSLISLTFVVASALTEGLKSIESAFNDNAQLFACFFGLFLATASLRLALTSAEIYLKWREWREKNPKADAVSSPRSV